MTILIILPMFTVSPAGLFPETLTFNTPSTKVLGNLESNFLFYPKHGCWYDWRQLDHLEPHALTRCLLQKARLICVCALD